MSWQDKDLLLSCHIQPGAKRSEFVGLHGDALKVRVAAPPVDGKANEALRRFLAEAFSVPTGSVELVSGESSRQKRLRIKNPGVLPEVVRELLDS